VLEDRYQIQRVLGIGGMGAVYAANDLRFADAQRLCAVKEMLPFHLEDEQIAQSRASFEREANLLASLSHPAIPKVYDYFHEGDRYFLVLEFIDGQDLETILDEAVGPLSQDQVVDWAIQTCAVLTYLHEHKPRPIIFRDMKPANIMLCKDGRIMLVDFGIAKQLQPAARGTMIGTEGYAPPEQYKGVADPRVDIYALGATMHHLLTNQDPRLEPPFSFQKRRIATVNPKVSPELIAIVERALAYEPQLRFQSAEQMRQALQGVHEGRGRMSTKARLLARVQKNRAKPVAQGYNTEPPPVQTQTAARSQGVTPLWTFKCEEEVRSSPVLSGRTLYIGCYDHNLYALDAKSGEFRWKYATEGGIAATPCVWNDMVIVGSEDRILYAVYTSTGRIAWSFATRGCIRSSPRVMGEYVFVGSDDHGIYSINVRKGNLRWKIEAYRPVRSSAAFLEHYVIFGAEDGCLYALDFSTGKAQWKFRAGGPIISSAAVDEQRIYLGSMDWIIYALDARSGWPVWQYRTRDCVVSSPALAEARLYIGSVDGHLYCLDAWRGKLIWRTDLGGQVTSSPAVANERVYVGAVNGKVFCLDCKTGKIIWSYATQGPVPSSPAVKDEVVYIGSTDHHVYALPA